MGCVFMSSCFIFNSNVGSLVSDFHEKKKITTANKIGSTDTDKEFLFWYSFDRYAEAKGMKYDL